MCERARHVAQRGDAARKGPRWRGAAAAAAAAASGGERVVAEPRLEAAAGRLDGHEAEDAAATAGVLTRAYAAAFARVPTGVWACGGGGGGGGRRAGTADTNRFGGDAAAWSWRQRYEEGHASAAALFVHQVLLAGGDGGDGGDAARAAALAAVARAARCALASNDFHLAAACARCWRHPAVARLAGARAALAAGYPGCAGVLDAAARLFFPPAAGPNPPYAYAAAEEGAEEGPGRSAARVSQKHVGELVSDLNRQLQLQLQQQQAPRPDPSRPPRQGDGAGGP